MAESELQLRPGERELRGEVHPALCGNFLPEGFRLLPPHQGLPAPLHRDPAQLPHPVIWSPWLRSAYSFDFGKYFLIFHKFQIKMKKNVKLV